MALRCQGLAQHLGEVHNQQNGVAPKTWLRTFGRALNLGANGHVERPLAIQGPDIVAAGGSGTIQTHLSLQLQQLSLVDLPSHVAGVPLSQLRLACRIQVKGNRWHPDRLLFTGFAKTGSSGDEGAAATYECRQWRFQPGPGPEEGGSLGILSPAVGPDEASGPVPSEQEAQAQLGAGDMMYPVAEDDLYCTELVVEVGVVACVCM